MGLFSAKITNLYGIIYLWKKLKFFIIENSQDKANEIFWSTNKNSTLKYKDRKIIFDSNIGDQEITVEVEYIKFNENLQELMEANEAKAFEIARTISTENMGFFKSGKTFSAVYSSVINKSNYKTPKSIFHFTARIFVKMIMGHKLTNGNKRISLVFLIGLLRNFGYHFKWSAGIWKDYSTYKTEVEQIAMRLENSKNSLSEDEKIDYVAEWIKGKCVIALEWRE